MPFFLFFVCLVLPSAALARSGAQDETAEQDNGRKEARAVRVPEGSIRLDGRLAEDIWRGVRRPARSLLRQRQLYGLRCRFRPRPAGAHQPRAGRLDRGALLTTLNPEGRTGLDMKIGLGSNLTVDATINPDFGQVEADPAEVNLTANETFFAERRPFFLEGSGLLKSSEVNWFYSRRIGGVPPGTAPPRSRCPIATSM